MDNETLKEYVLNCKKCELFKTRTNVVFGDGNINSNIMLIGEAPGEQEDLKGIPFVGKAGQLLDKMLASINLDRTKVYICNMLKCRPPKNRNPKEEEMQVCIDFLRRQFLIVKPKLIILLGSVASRFLLDETFSMNKSHGVVFERKGVLFVPTFHPSALLRDENKKKLSYSDLLKIKDIIDKNNLLDIKE